MSRYFWGSCIYDPCECFIILIHPLSRYCEIMALKPVLEQITLRIEKFVIFVLDMQQEKLDCILEKDFIEENITRNLFQFFSIIHTGLYYVAKQG